MARVGDRVGSHANAHPRAEPAFNYAFHITNSILASQARNRRNHFTRTYVDDRAAHVAHFTAAVYILCSMLFDVQLSIFTDVQSLWERGELTITCGSITPFVLSRARCGESRSRYLVSSMTIW